jgi:hypothetical protein
MDHQRLYASQGAPGPHAARAPQALARPQGATEFYARRLIWALICGVTLFLIGRARRVDQLFVAQRAASTKSFRCFLLSLAVIVAIAAYLLPNTSKVGDRAENMKNEHPVAAYSMAAAAVVLFFSSFIFWADLLGLIGILFFIAFWGFLLNFVIACGGA